MNWFGLLKKKAISYYDIWRQRAVKWKPDIDRFMWGIFCYIHVRPKNMTARVRFGILICWKRNRHVNLHPISIFFSILDCWTWDQKWSQQEVGGTMLKDVFSHPSWVTSFYRPVWDVIYPSSTYFLHPCLLQQGKLDSYQVKEDGK